MAYSKKELEKQALDVIKKNKLTWHDEIIAFLPCTKSTYYNKKLHELDSLKDAILQNRLEMKAKLKKKWFESDNPTLSIALMKLIANDEEWDKLNTQKSKNQTETTGSIQFDFN